MNETTVLRLPLLPPPQTVQLNLFTISTEIKVASLMLNAALYGVGFCFVLKMHNVLF